MTKLKTILQITEILNPILGFQYFSLWWKMADVILVPKLENLLNGIKSYRFMSLISNISKITGRILINRLNYYITLGNLPNCKNCYQINLKK